MTCFTAAYDDNLVNAVTSIGLGKQQHWAGMGATIWQGGGVAYFEFNAIYDILPLGDYPYEVSADGRPSSSPRDVIHPVSQSVS